MRDLHFHGGTPCYVESEGILERLDAMATPWPLDSSNREAFEYQVAEAYPSIRRHIEGLVGDCDALLTSLESANELNRRLIPVVQGARRWVNETSPGQHVNTAVGRSRTVAALAALDEEES